LQSMNAEDWSAYFACVLALKIPGEKVRFFEGKVDGMIIPERRGNKGFGFDPVFVPDGWNKTFAEVEGNEKAAVSHRGKALRCFIEEMFGAK